MNTREYVNALFIMERSKDAKSIDDCINYVVEELKIYSEEESEQILNHLIPMMLEFFRGSRSSTVTFPETEEL
jgi:uncharacterized protein YmfQ (DUF2313 family)